jgi:hypothetical protein
MYMYMNIYVYICLHVYPYIHIYTFMIHINFAYNYVYVYMYEMYIYVFINMYRAWTLKKMYEYLGEEEHTLTDFILSKLRKQCQPIELLTGRYTCIYVYILTHLYIIYVWKYIRSFYSLKTTNTMVTYRTHDV